MKDKETPIPAKVFAAIIVIYALSPIDFIPVLGYDYFPTNFVVQDEQIYYIDYECNDYMEEWNFENWGIKYWSKTSEFLKYLESH